MAGQIIIPNTINFLIAAIIITDFAWTVKSAGGPGDTRRPRARGPWANRRDTLGAGSGARVYFLRLEAGARSLTEKMVLR
ncbi:MAG: hypothetical protein ABIM19_04160 [candidate division WOR-3 bacterium]